ncbi:hypothetical protein [Bacillus sp. TH12]|uniref:hypothetical protein n=1 Tax=Bacillus sp. TH12 TaxID=2796378 RepID=UPI001912939F|nr:hypothetical protein [Bacillus sp. TH12]MBK5503543.1 hypothetical protein [Bacillus sp. TH12]
MSRKALVTESNQYLEQAHLARRQQDENTERESLQKFFELFEKLLPKDRIHMEENLYYPYRNIARFLANSNEFADCIKYINRATAHSKYSNELLDNKVNMKLLQSRSYLMLYLQDGASNHLKTAKELIDSISVDIDKVINASLLNDFSNLQEIYSAIVQNNVWTTINLELPFPIIASERPISFIYKETQITLQIEVIDSPYKMLNVEGTGFIEIIEDKYGLANRSKVSLSINKYLHPDLDINLVGISETNQISEVIAECIEVLNFFIERFRVTTGKYWIETISHKMLSQHSVVIKAGNQTIRNIPLADSTSYYKFSPNIPWITKDKETSLIENLSKIELPLWKSLLLDSKDYFLRGKHKEAIVSINSAFENFLAIEVKNHLAKGMSTDEITTFLNGKPIFENFFLNKFISEEKFNEAIQEGIINNMPPTTFAIMKKCNHISPLGISNSQLQKLVSKIRSKRNDVVHGKEDVIVSTKNVKDAIESLEKLISLFLN